MCFRCGGILNDHFITAESNGERILKISQHLATLWATVVCPVLLTHPRHTHNDNNTSRKQHNLKLAIHCSVTLESINTDVS